MAFGIMFGLVKPKRMVRFLMWLVLGPVIIGFALTLAKQVFFSLPVLQQIILVVLVAGAGVVIILRFALPRGVRDGLISHLIYDLLKYLPLLSVRLGSWMVNFMRRRKTEGDAKGQ